MSFFTPLKGDMTDNCLVSVCHFGDQLYALTETNLMRRIDPETLDCVGEKASLFPWSHCSSLTVSCCRSRLDVMAVLLSYIRTEEQAFLSSYLNL